MNDLNANTAVALHLGYTFEDRTIMYDGAEIQFRIWKTPSGDGMGKKWPPDYGSDLNACHEIERFLTEDQVRVYVDHLAFLNNAGNGAIRFHGRWACASATATQRREAFLKTLNLWTD